MEAGTSKNTVLETWKVCEQVTATFCALGTTPTPSIVDVSLDTLERFVVLMYDRTSNHEHVNDERKQHFTQKGRAIEAPGYCWGQMMVAAAELPSPSEWGWMKSDTGWDLCWTTLPEATKACRHCVLAMRLQEGMQRTMQVQEGCTSVQGTAADSVLGTRTCSINALPQWQFRLMLIR